MGRMKGIKDYASKFIIEDGFSCIQNRYRDVLID